MFRRFARVGYKRLPSPVQQAVKSVGGQLPVRWRLGKQFFDELNFLEKSQWWSAEQLADYQNERLRKLIRHTYENVPYYRDLFREHQITPDDICNKHDLINIPILTKQTLRERHDELIATNYQPSQLSPQSTSGTTGTPTRFNIDASREFLSFDPYVWRFFGWAGHRPGQKRAVITATWEMPGSAVHIYNPIRNTLVLTPLRLNLETVDRYADALRQFNIHYLDGHPSSIEMLTRLLKSRDIAPPTQFNAVFCHSECLLAWQREAIESYWDCKAFDWYAMEEQVVMALECERHEGLHLLEDFSIAEFIEDKASEWRRIVATGLVNFGMPLIRYDTGDLARLRGHPCSCGRAFPLVELAGGRNRNFAYSRDGSLVSVTHLAQPPVTDNVIEFQFVQREVGRLTLNIVVNEAFESREIESIQEKLDRKFGESFDIEIRRVDQLEKKGVTKTPMFVQCADTALYEDSQLG